MKKLILFICVTINGPHYSHTMEGEPQAAFKKQLDQVHENIYQAIEQNNRELMEQIIKNNEKPNLYIAFVSLAEQGNVTGMKMMVDTGYELSATQIQCSIESFVHPLKDIKNKAEVVRFLTRLLSSKTRKPHDKTIQLITLSIKHKEQKIQRLQQQTEVESTKLEVLQNSLQRDKETLDILQRAINEIASFHYYNR